MKKIVLSNFILSFIFAFYSIHLHAQQYSVANGGFEMWTDGIPNSWSKYYESETDLVQTTDAYSGDFALQLLNKDAKGCGATISIQKVGTILPAKLKGFVKYNISPNQRARITVSLGKTLTYTGGSSTTYDVAGWVSFSGNSSDNYVPFEIEMDYRLIKLIGNNNGVIPFDVIEVRAESFGPIYEQTSFYDATSVDIKANTFITIDDLSFDGSISNSGIPNLIGIPNMFEDWALMDGKYISPGIILSGSSAAENDMTRIISRSEDAHTGKYAMSANLVGKDTSFGFITVYTKTQTQTQISFSVKGVMGAKDSIKAILSTSAGRLIQNIKATDITNSYQTYTFDVSSLDDNSSNYFILAFIKHSSEPYSVLFDDLTVDGEVTTANQDAAYLQSIVASPNPSNGLFVLQNAGDNSVAVYNITGSLINATVYNVGHDMRVDISDSPKGLYFINIGGKKVMKVIKD